MIAYASLAVTGLAVAAVAGVLLTLLTPARRRVRLLPVIVTTLVLLALTVVFDSLMIAAGLFRYAPELLLGAHLWLAPIEDFAYPLAGAVLLPALWAFLLSRRERAKTATERAETATVRAETADGATRREERR